MNRYPFGLFSYLCLTATASAEPAVPDPTYLKNHVETKGYMLGRPVKPRPTPDGKAVLFLRASPRLPELRLYEFDVATAKTRELVTPEEILKGAEEVLSAEERARRERMRVTLRGFTGFDLSPDGSFVLLSLSGRLYTVRRDGGAKQITLLKTGDTPAIDPHLSPDGKKVAYVRDRDLYVLDLATQLETRLTKSTDPLVTNGLAEFIAQEELRRHTGFFWSPDSASLCYEEADSRGVEIFHPGDPVHPERAPHPVPYPRPGKANAKLRLGIVALGKQGQKGEHKTTWLKWDQLRFPYLATVRWPEGGKAPLTVVVLSRDQRDLEVLAADPRTGDLRRLLAEHDDAWLNLHQDVPRWLKDGSGFLWSSERNGALELELRDPQGALVRVLANKDSGYTELVSVDDAAGQAIVATAREPSTRHLFRVAIAPASVEAEKPAPLAAEPAQAIHTAVFSKNHALQVRTVTAPTSMPVATVHRSDGSLVGDLPSVAESPPFRVTTEFTRVGPSEIRAAITRPRNFQAGKKVPVILHVYGGPAHQMVTASMAHFLLDQWLADHGYLVVSFDGRGTPNRGRQWERALKGSFAKVPLEDQVTGLRELGKRISEMDLGRVGVYGWSYGGYMAALAVLRRPDVFHVGVAGAPVVDWRDYDTAYTERYIGMPDQDKANYEESSLLTYAASLTRPLLLIHGTGDDNVYFLHTLKLSNALFRAGKHHEVLPLLGLTHMVPDPLVTERLWGRILDTFGATLQKGR